MEPEKGHNLDADPGNEPAQSEGQTATVDESVNEMSLEALEDLTGQEAGEKPEEIKPPAKEPAVEPWYNKLNIPGLDSEEKALQAINFIRSDYGRIVREIAELKKPSQKSTETGKTETEKKEEIPGLSAFIDKHSIKDATGNVISTNYDAAMKEYTEVREKNLITRIGEFLQETQTSNAKATKVRTDLENLAKEGLLPEYRLPTYKDGEVVDAGSEFGQQVQGYMDVLEERFAKRPFHLDPEKEFFVAAFADWMRSTQEKRTAKEAAKKRRHPMSENTPPIGSFTHKGKDVNSMTEAEIEDVLASMESK